MISSGITSQTVRDAIEVRQDRLWRGRDAIFPCVVGALTLVAVTATVITVGIYARKYKWMPTQERRWEKIDGKKVYVTKTVYDTGPALFGSLVGVIGGPLISLAALGLCVGLIAIPKGIKWNRLDDKKNAVTDETALDVFRQQIPHLPDSALVPCVQEITKEQLLEIRSDLGDKLFWKLATELPGIGEKRCAFRLLRDLEEAEDREAFIEEHAEQLYDHDPDEYPLGESGESELPGLKDKDDAELMALIENEREEPNAALRARLKEAVKMRVDEVNHDEWEEFLEDSTSEVLYTVADYGESWDRCYGDLLDSIYISRPHKPSESDPEEEEDELDQADLERLQTLQIYSNVIDDLLNLEGVVDLSSESTEMQEGLEYLETKILNHRLGQRAAVQEMLASPEAPIANVIAFCEKYQFLGVLDEIERQLESKMYLAENDSECMRWLEYMPDSLRLIERAGQRYSRLSQSELLARLVKRRTTPEREPLQQAVTNQYTRPTVLSVLRVLNTCVAEISKVEEAPDLALFATHEERMWALRAYEAATLQESKNALRDRLARDLEAGDLQGADAEWFKRVWEYAEHSSDQTLQRACAEALANVSDAAFQNRLPDLWDGRIPPALYSGWRHNPVHQSGHDS